MTKSYQFKIATLEGHRTVIGHITKMTDPNGEIVTFTMHQNAPKGRWIVSDFDTGYRVMETRTTSYHQARQELKWRIENDDFIRKVQEAKEKTNRPIINR